MRLILDFLIVIFMFAGSLFCFRKLGKGSLSSNKKHIISLITGILFTLPALLLDRHGFFVQNIKILFMVFFVFLLIINLILTQKEMISDELAWEKFAEIYPVPMLVRVLNLSSFKDIFAFAEAQERGKQPPVFVLILILSYILLFFLWLVLIVISQEQFGPLIFLLAPYGIIVVILSFIFTRGSWSLKYPFIIVFTENKLSILKKLGDSGQVVGSWLFSELESLEMVPLNNMPFLKMFKNLLRIETKQGEKHLFSLNFGCKYFQNQDYYEIMEALKENFRKIIQEKSTSSFK